jgi:hypothetical protein
VRVRPCCQNSSASKGACPSSPGHERAAELGQAGDAEVAHLGEQVVEFRL